MVRWTGKIVETENGTILMITGHKIAKTAMIILREKTGIKIPQIKTKRMNLMTKKELMIKKTTKIMEIKEKIGIEILITKNLIDKTKNRILTDQINTIMMDSQIMKKALVNLEETGKRTEMTA